MNYRHGSQKTLRRGDFPQLAYRLGCSRATGVLRIYAEGATTSDVLVLHQGSLQARSSDALGRRTRQHLARIASMRRARYTFESGTIAQPAGASTRPFSLAVWARSHFEAQLDSAQAKGLVARFTGVLLSIAPDSVPATSMCDQTDLRILDALSSPRRLDQIWHHARTPRYRLLAFLHFLSCVGALELSGDALRVPEPAPRHTPHRVLGVREGADGATIKRAYRQLARSLHPDLHPAASAQRRRHLERRLAQVTDAYAELSH